MQSSKKSATAVSSNATVISVTACFTVTKSSIKSGCFSALMPNPPTSVSPACRNIRSLSQARGENVIAADGSCRQRCRDSDREGSAAVWVCRAARKLGSRGLLCFAGKGMGLFMGRLRWGLGLIFCGIVNWIVRYGCVFRGLFFFVSFLSFFVVQDFALGTEPISVVVLLRAAKTDRLLAAIAGRYAVVAKVALAGFA